MKMIVVAFALVALAVAAPPDVAQIVRSTFEKEPSGAYQFSYETEDGVVRQEGGEIKQAFDEDNKPHDVVVVRGSFSYPKEGGTVETVQYYADETGYHAEGDSIPKVVARR